MRRTSWRVATLGLLWASLWGATWWLDHAASASLWGFMARVGLVIVALVTLGRRARIYPQTRLAALWLLPALVSAGAVINPAWRAAALVLDAALLMVALVDLAHLPTTGALTIQRELGRVASLGKRHPVTLTLTNLLTRDAHVIVRDGVPWELNAEPAEFAVHVPPRSRTTLEYHLRPARRGAMALQTTFLRVPSRWGLWLRDFQEHVPGMVHVYPDLKQLDEYALLARTDRLSLMGLRKARLIGQDNEFERLRDYTLDDNFKHIDWRSTARRQKLTVRDFQANQSQRLMFLIDCGRMMTNTAAGLSLLDHAFNAMLMLSYVALSKGDNVGALLFSDEIHAFVPPGGGRGHMQRLLHAAFDRFPRRVESRYDEAFLQLNSRCRKRSLVVLITNVIDDVNTRQIQGHLGRLVGRHLPLGVLLRDRRVFDALAVDDADDENIYRRAAAADMLAWRHQTLGDLQASGVLSLDVFPEQLTAPLVNQYLDIKARHLL